MAPLEVARPKGPSGAPARARPLNGVGVEKIYLCGITPGPVDRFGKIRPQFQKVSLGAESYVEWQKVNATGKLIDKLKKEKYKIFAIEQNKKSIPYYKLKAKNYKLKATALVLGSETRGLSKSILNKADKILEIPMRGAMVRQAHHPRQLGRGKESLNVSVVFGIIAFYLQISNSKI